MTTDFTYRTFNPAPTGYERELADALFTIMGRSIHDPAAIATELNRTGPKPAHGGPWTETSFKAEMRRLGTWTNSIGAPLGEHTLPGAARRVEHD